MAPETQSSVAADPFLNDPHHEAQPILPQTASTSSASSASSTVSCASSSSAVLSELSKQEIDRLIAENMASVLKSLKKRKHAKKHARLRQAAAAAPVTVEGGEADKAPETLETMPKSSKTNDSSEQKEMNDSAPKRRTSPRKIKQEIIETAESDVKQRKQTKKEGLKEVQTVKDLPAEAEIAVNGPVASPTKQQQEKGVVGKENKTINAFQLMMKARSKCIGSNSPGKERSAEEATEEPILTPQQELKAKRKLQLEKWAERKGAGKRRIQEDAQEEYIDHQLRKRAKRLKRLINNMHSPEEKQAEANGRISRRSSAANAKKLVNGEQEQEEPVETIQASIVEPPATPPMTPSAADEVDEKPLVLDVEIVDNNSGDEFLRQLSSPRKKKDSLLGYFNKVAPEVEKKGPKKHSPTTGRPSATVTRRSKTAVVASPSTAVSDAKKSPTSTPSTSAPVTDDGSASRPRRSCANRIKDYSTFERDSPQKEQNEPKKPSAPTVTPLKIINVQSPSAMKVIRSPSVRMFMSVDGGSSDGAPIVIDDDSTLPATPKSVKLAPVFVKAAPTTAKNQPPPIDPERARARQLFLMSGLPEKLRQEIDRKAAYEEFILNESPVFPLVSHVVQLDQAEQQFLRDRPVVDFARSCIKLRPPEVLNSPAARKAEVKRMAAMTMASRKIRLGTFTTCGEYDYEDALVRCIGEEDREAYDASELPEVVNVKAIVRDYKQRYQHFPVFKCYKQFRAIYEEHRVKQPDPAATNELDESLEIVETQSSFRNGELLFTEKYKPQNTEQILVNYVPATLLKRFLTPWQEESNGGPAGNRRAVPAVNGDYYTANSSGDDECSNGSTSSSIGMGVGGGTAVCNHVVLVGPPGCGKTCNVYAVANEMNFQVLEINASSRRKGRLILQELLEATQSHQVRKNASEAPKGGRTMNGNILSSCLQRRPSVNDGASGKKKLSLILIEDADIVFDQDEGFVSAINQLVATSKRPIVLTTTNAGCPHLARYMARNNVIHYVAPGIENVSKFLSLLALVERVQIDQQDIGRLYARNGKDMRKTLNELQFYIHSASASGSGQSERDSNQVSGGGEGVGGALYRLFTANQNEPMVLELPLAFDTLWCNMELALREAKNFPLLQPLPSSVTPSGRKKKRKGKQPSGSAPASLDEEATQQLSEVRTLDALGVLYENISRAEVDRSIMERNRVRYGRDPQDDQCQQQLAEEIGHTLLEGSWIEWFQRSKPAVASSEVEDDEIPAPARAYDGLRRMEQEPRQTIAANIGVSGIRSRITSCDYEPFLRQICRHERDRSQQERRGSRFYHYLRNHALISGMNGGGGAVNGGGGNGSGGTGFSMDHFDALSQRFEQEPTTVTTTTTNGNHHGCEPTVN